MPMQKKAPIGGSCNFSNGLAKALSNHSVFGTPATSDFTTFCSVAASGAETCEKFVSTFFLASEA